MLKPLCFFCFLFLGALSQEPESIYQLSVKSIDGQTIPLSAFEGRALLIVNTALNDKNAGQIQELEELYQKYSEKGLVVLAFPSDSFGEEVKGSSQDLRNAYQERFHLTFPLLDKVNVTYPDISPLYAFLTNTKTDPTYGWEVDWNFTKFLVGPNGQVLNRFNTVTKPNDPKVIAAIEKALNKPNP